MYVIEIYLIKWNINCLINEKQLKVAAATDDANNSDSAAADAPAEVSFVSNLPINSSLNIIMSFGKKDSEISPTSAPFQ